MQDEIAVKIYETIMWYLADSDRKSAESITAAIVSIIDKEATPKVDDAPKIRFEMELLDSTGHPAKVGDCVRVLLPEIDVQTNFDPDGDEDSRYYQVPERLVYGKIVFTLWKGLGLKIYQIECKSGTQNHNVVGQTIRFRTRAWKGKWTVIPF